MNNILRSPRYLYSLLFLAITGISIYFLIVGYSSPITSSEGNLSITVKFKGTPPAPPQMKTQKAKSLCGMETIPYELLIVGTGNEIKNAMVYIKGATGTIPPKDYALINRHCAFSPHVGFAIKGSKLTLANEDEVLHNTHAYFVMGKMKKTLFNTALPKGTKPVSNPTALRAAGLIEVACDAHEWMSSRIIVVDNPYYSITGDNGKAEIKNIPAGEYDLVIYHETLGELTKKVKVTAGQSDKVEVEFQ